MVIEVREVQLAKAYCPIEVRVFGSMTEVREEHPLKIESPI